MAGSAPPHDADHQQDRQDGNILNQKNPQGQPAAYGIDRCRVHQNAKYDRRGTQCHHDTDEHRIAGSKEWEENAEKDAAGHQDLQ